MYNNPKQEQVSDVKGAEWKLTTYRAMENQDLYSNDAVVQDPPTMMTSGHTWKETTGVQVPVETGSKRTALEPGSVEKVVGSFRTFPLAKGKLENSDRIAKG